MSVRPKRLQQHDGISHDVLARKCKAILLGKSLQLFHENPKIGPLVFGKKSQILSLITLPASPLFHELWGQKNAGCMHLSTIDTTNESQEVSPFPAGDHKAHINRHSQRHSQHKTEKNTLKIHTRSTALERSVKCFTGGLKPA